MKQKHIILTPTQHTILTTIIHKTTSQQRLVARAKLVLDVSEATSNKRAIAKANHTSPDMLHRWVSRWLDHADQLARYEQDFHATAESFSLSDYSAALITILSDAPRPGAPPTITEAQKQQIIALATQKPEDAGVPVTHWSHSLLAETAVDKDIVPTISSTHLGRFLKMRHSATTS
jgi:hypothetical protein